MKRLNQVVIKGWQELGPRFLPFADAATTELPLGRLLRLSLFQVSVGMAMVLLTGTLNRVMIVELGVPAWLVGLMVSLPIVFAPFRALIGFKSDTHRSVLGWRRVPYIWFGTLLQFGGFAILPFALLVLTGDGHGPAIYGQIGAALAFLLVGAGIHTTQTAGLALANDLAPPEARPRVVALLYVMLLLGMVVSALVFGTLLRDFSAVKLIQIIQGAAVITAVLNGIAMWQQEARNPALTSANAPRTTFREAWTSFASAGRAKRLLVAVGLGSAAFSMQDILLEPFGGQVFAMSVGQTTWLTAILAAGTLVGFALAARRLARGGDPYRIASLGILAGITAFAAVSFAPLLELVSLFQTGAFFIGFGGGLFSVGMLTAAMELASSGSGTMSGIALGAWGGVQATAAGLAIAASGTLRDLISTFAENGTLGAAFSGPAAGYLFVYQIEIVLLFATLVAIGPMVRVGGGRAQRQPSGFGLAEYPG
ncbi:BCD family MFS transporter [Aestuariivirga sp.]|uniref:BCD family MFS transporter n=1 Tax=Aestuariivirga sp. TaxID=2650926 RepID=UPI00359478BE